MKTIYILFAAVVMAVLAGVAPCHAQDSPQNGAQENRRDTLRRVSPLRFDVTEWDFGDIREDGGVVSHVFGFVNEGENPVAIDRAVASCGCTTPEYSGSLVAPGERGEIKVSFDPTGYPGYFSKSIAVVSGGRKYSNFLTIKGQCFRY